MKPNIKFLEKVRDGKVMHVKGYSARSGGYWRFVGGEQTARQHAQAGLINFPRSPVLGRPGIATLTDAGRAALESSVITTVNE